MDENALIAIYQHVYSEFQYYIYEKEALKLKKINDQKEKIS